MVEMSDNQKWHNIKYVPLVQNLKIRTTIGFILLVLSTILAGMIFGNWCFEIVVPVSIFTWIVSVFLTDKYIHKYPRRYFTYLLASHLKAAIIMAFFLWMIGRFVSPVAAVHDVLWTWFIFFALADAAVSVLRSRDVPNEQSLSKDSSSSIENISDTRSDNLVNLSMVNTQAIIQQISSDPDRQLVEFVRKNMPDLNGRVEDVLFLDDVQSAENYSKSISVGFLVDRTRINDVCRLNRFLQFCTERITMGGYLVIRYIPLENVVKDLKRRYRGLWYWVIFVLHFIWYRALPKIPWLDTFYFSSKISWLDSLLAKKRNRVLSKAEVWGRLSFWGMDVISESEVNNERFLLARRVTWPVQNKRPSYYPIVALEKVGLEGKIIRMHKFRTMFPFSEFIQKRIFEDHGLTASGKFVNDFRLTGIGKFLRKYWLDELPQIFDWLRGDVKLVGIRATSRHFLSLYPKKFLDLYVQVKPGFIPPVFDESTGGFDQIVRVELNYLESYWKRPIRTDIRCFLQTFTDIVFKGVRSK